MQPSVLAIHVLMAISLVALVLLQHGKGADVGAAFGSGASNTMFGSAGSTPFLMKVTILLATIFFVTSLALSYLVARAARHPTPLLLPNTEAPAPASSLPPVLPGKPPNA